MTGGGAEQVLVAHPGRQHSLRLADALAGVGMLAGYWAGIPGSAEAPLPAQATIRPIAPLLRRILSRTGVKGGALWGDYLGNRLFDAWAARRIARIRADAVIGYEVGCGRTFERARHLGMTTILDAASLHHRTQDRWSSFDGSASLRRRIVAVKEREIALADHILVGSGLAAQSYREGGVIGQRISVVHPGVDLTRFELAERAREGGLSVLFVGKLSRIKGFDLLLESFGRASRQHPGMRMRIAGQGDWPSAMPPGVVAGPVPHHILPILYQEADILVLPSRLDGFGLVVAEALACGTPVLVSDHVGAKDLVEEGINGWILTAEDIGALSARLSWCADHLGIVRSMRPACRASIQDHDWGAYGRRLVEVVRSVIAEHAA